MHEHVHADLVVVDSRDAAIGELAHRVPDVILLTALLSPRDEEELVNHLRTLPAAEHLQTHTIPQLAGSRGDDDEDGRPSGGLLGMFRRKKAEPEPIAGCDPTMFAEEIRTFLQRAAEVKAFPIARPVERSSEPQEASTSSRARSWALKDEEDTPTSTPEAGEPGEVDTGSAWASPFEWRRSEPGAKEASAPTPEKPSLVSNVPLAVFAEEQEQQLSEAIADAGKERARADQEDKAAAERERLRLEEEAAEQERQRLE